VSASSGVSLIELIAAMAVTMVLVGAVIGLLGAMRGIVTAQPEVADLQQRLRVALQQLAGELANAGAGLDGTPLAGPLASTIPAIMPHRRGAVDDDGRAGRWFRPDAVSVVCTAIIPQPISTPTAAGMIAPFVATTDPTVAPIPTCTSGIAATWLKMNGMRAVRAS